VHIFDGASEAREHSKLSPLKASALCCVDVAVLSSATNALPSPLNVAEQVKDVVGELLL
jgi:hypothetical protein